MSRGAGVMSLDEICLFTGFTGTFGNGEVKLGEEGHGRQGVQV